MNPYLIIGALIGLIAISVGSFFYGHHIGYISEKAVLDLFVSEIKETALKQQRDNAELERQRDATTHSLEAKHASDISNLDHQYQSELARVRQPARTRSSGVPTLADSAKGLCKSITADDVAARLAGLETGILGILKKGDSEIQRRSEMSEWLRVQGFKEEQ